MEVGWTSPSLDRRETIYCFPYIDPKDNRLRIWDMGSARDLATSVYRKMLVWSGGDGKAKARKTKRRRLSVDSFHADDVRQKWPKMYAMIRNMGYWKDVNS